MRAILSKAVAISMIAGAGLLVTACKTETTATVNNTTTEVVPVENAGAMDTMTGDMDAANGTVTTSNTVETTNVTVGNAM